jgi:hypothetical protein
MLKLNLDNNLAIGYDGLKFLGETLLQGKIMDLRIRNVAKWVDFDDITCDTAVTQESQSAQACHALIVGVRGNVYLEKLNADGNSLSG